VRPAASRALHGSSALLRRVRSGSAGVLRGTATRSGARLRTAGHVAAAVGAAVALVAGVGLQTTPALADTKEELQRRQREYARERERVSAALEGTSSQLSQTYLALQDIRARLPIAEAELQEAVLTLATKQREAEAVTARLQVAEQQQETLKVEIAEGEAEEERIRVAIGQLARSTYRDGADLSTLSVVLEATTPEEFASRYSVMDAARRTQTQALTDLANTIAVRRNVQARLDAVQKRIAELKAEADAAVIAAQEARNAAAARKAEIERLRNEAEVKAAALESQKQQYESQRARIDADNRAVANQIAAIVAAEAAERERQRRAAAAAAARARAEAEAAARAGRAARGSTGGGGAVAAPSTSSFLAPPISGPLYVTSPYGYRVYPITGGWFMHNGVDLRSSCGSPQYASASGTVVGIGYAASNGTHGNQVIINHGVLNGRSTATVYNHLSRFAVSTGQRVSKGQVIGYTGETGNVTGCHVHFELWLDGSPVDPMNYL
jgi:murein DD-endopeptidase MepM/ murein hydrolase activator NlpD